MYSFWCVLVLGCVAGGLLLVGAQGASAGCNRVLGTADGFNQEDALSGAQAALEGAVTDLKAQRRTALSVSPIRPKPQPYWRDVVTPDLFFKPDVVTARSHTVCWRGVVSPVVCTSAAKVCW